MTHDLDQHTPRGWLGGWRGWRKRIPLICVLATLPVATEVHAVTADAPMTLDALEIRGEFMAPQALFIVGGDAADDEGAATVLDYLDGWHSEAEPLRIILMLTPPSSWRADRAAQARPDVRAP
jgi:hypothetical protein